MAPVNITINGLKISAQAGVTVLQAASQASIDIPTLCNHPALSPVGACRMCVVEIQGQRNLQTACTFPVAEGMDIQTESPRVVGARKLILDMIFSERNHFCMYCEASGSCELQSLGYRYKLDHWVFPTYTKPFPMDASHKYYAMEHNRCILCWRCIRGCSEIVANHTLGLRQRGSVTMIHADANLPLGESSCVSCGTCVQLCPTGALFNKRSAFMGRDSQIQKIKSTCSQCSVGCGMEIVTRGGNVLRIESDWEAPVNKGLLCIHGRFEPLNDQRERITEPMIKQNGKLEKVSWKKAIQTLAKHIGSVSAAEIGVLASSNATNEALYLINKLFLGELKATNVGMLNKVTPKHFSGSRGSLADINEVDVIALVCADPLQDQPVVAYSVKRAVDRGARLIIVNDHETGLAPFAFLNLGIKDLNKACEIVERAEHPLILYSSEITQPAVNILKKLEGKASFLPLEPGVNTRAAEALQLNNGFTPSAARLLYVLLGEQNYDSAALLKDIPKNAFVAVSSSYVSALTEKADLVLPAAIWTERDGSITNTEGRVQKVNQAVKPAGDAKVDWDAISLLADEMGKKIDISIDKISAHLEQLLK